MYSMAVYYDHILNDCRFYFSRIAIDFTNGRSTDVACSSWHQGSVSVERIDDHRSTQRHSRVNDVTNRHFETTLRHTRETGKK